MKLLTFIILLLVIPTTKETEPITYLNDTSAQKALTDFRKVRINEITIKPDGTFEFWNREHTSCLLWREYKGTWEKNRNKITFHNQYEVTEPDLRSSYKMDHQQKFYSIKFSTDKKSKLKNRKIKIIYIYDFDAGLTDVKKDMILHADNSILIPFDSIPNREELASFRVIYQWSETEKRVGYLMEDKSINQKEMELANQIQVTFLEKPKKEVIHRTIKGQIEKKTLKIISSNKTKTELPDYQDDIVFEEVYMEHKY